MGSLGNGVRNEKGKQKECGQEIPRRKFNCRGCLGLLQRKAMERDSISGFEPFILYCSQPVP